MPQHIIYCWSGTGNSLADAKAIADALGGAQILPMRGAVPQEAQTIGFIFPTYFWTLPALMADFIRGESFPSGAYYYAVATCAELAMNALYDLDALLREKGLHLSYHAKHTHVGNYITAYPRFPEPSKRVPEAARTLEPIAAAIVRRASIAPPRLPIPGAAQMQRAFYWLLTHGDLGAQDAGFHVSDACTACGLCASLCPAGNITLEHGRPVFRHRCAQCMACIQYCPREAINYKNATQKRARYHHPAISAPELVRLLGPGQRTT